MAGLQGLNAQELKVISFNIHNNSSPKTDGPNAWYLRQGWDAKTPRTVTILQLKVKETGKEIFYFNTHQERDGSVAHAESVKVIASLIAQYVPKGTPVIVGGDMNSEIINNDFQPLYDAGFTPARRLASRTDFRNSYNAFGYEPGAMNDHFLVRDINVQRFRTINKDYGVPYISNHYPVRMIIKL